MSSSYRLELDKWLSQLDVKADYVLDIGGSQLPVKGRTKSWDVEKYLIADMLNPHVDSPKPDIYLDLNAPRIDWPFTKAAEGSALADLVFCLEVFEYVWNPYRAMTTIRQHMHGVDAKAWVTFPSFYPTHQPIEDDSLRYMEGGIRKLADHTGLKIEEMIKRRPETNALRTAWATERMRAAKGYDHDFTGWIVRFSK